MSAINLLTLVSDQEGISPYEIKTVESRQEMRMKKLSIMDYLLIQYQILQTYIIGIVWQTVRRITNEILGVKGLTHIFLKRIVKYLSKNSSQLA